MVKSQYRLWVGLAFLLALGVTLRCWFIAHTPMLAGDTFIYGDIALSWMRHGIYGFSQPPGNPTPTLIRLPGYPLFLMLCFGLFGQEHYTAVMRFQCLFDVAGCLILAALARRLFGRRAALVTFTAAILCPFTASYVAAPLTETLTLFCIVVAFYAFERWRTVAGAVAPLTSSHSQASLWNHWLWVLAATLAYAILLRPEQGLLAASILPAVLWTTSRVSSDRGSRGSVFAPALAAGLCTLLPLVPWTIRNADTFHVFQPLAPRSAIDPGEPVPAGFDHWYRTWGIDLASTEDVYWNYDGAPIQIADIPSRAFDSPAQFAETDDLLRTYNLTNKPSPEIEDRFFALARELSSAHPIRTHLGLPVARLLNMLLRPRIEMLPVSTAWWRWGEHPAQTAFALAYGALNIVYLTAGITGLSFWIRRRNDSHRVIALSLAAFFVLRCALLLTLDNSEPRYTLEFFPMLILGIGALFRGDDRSNDKSGRAI